MEIVIIDYGMGNIGSIINMIKKAGGESRLTSDPGIIRKAGKIIIPGVGAFDHGMKNLNESGITEVLHEKACIEKVPVLGVCLGMQLMSKSSEEGVLPGLGWIDARTVRFNFGPDSGLRIPHMGWNDVEVLQSEPLFRDMPDEPSFYFVHSYHVVCNDPGDVSCRTVYGYGFVSAVQHGNIMATQFHPEKSHKYGLQLIRNFVNLK